MYDVWAQVHISNCQQWNIPDTSSQHKEKLHSHCIWKSCRFNWIWFQWRLQLSSVSLKVTFTVEPVLSDTSLSQFKSVAKGRVSLKTGALNCLKPCCLHWKSVLKYNMSFKAGVFEIRFYCKLIPFKLCMVTFFYAVYIFLFYFRCKVKRLSNFTMRWQDQDAPKYLVFSNTGAGHVKLSEQITVQDVSLWQDNSTDIFNFLIYILLNMWHLNKLHCFLFRLNTNWQPLYGQKEQQKLRDIL